MTKHLGAGRRVEDSSQITDDNAGASAYLRKYNLNGGIGL